CARPSMVTRFDYW
nr:immunoglobulin heavy chain junction region [Mus musculus]NSM06977.1 immunoglobulin heavy chain junction region [Mus musculus]NSM08650.1 immunoglobulin heavy chain junction region [Mus musculus]